MPLFRSGEIRIAALSSALLIASLGPRIACATLGEAEMSVQSDVAQLGASVKSSQDRAGYRLHEIQLPGGTMLREFVAPNGNVFAVAWNGPTKPICGRSWASISIPTSPRPSRSSRTAAT